MTRLLASVLVVTAALVGCGPTVSIHRAPDARLERRDRWAWAPADGDGIPASEGARTPPDSVAWMLRTAIETELTAKGHALTTPDSAQFLVHYHVAQRAITDTLPVRDDPPGIVRAPGNWGRYGNPEELDARLITWQEGVLVIDALTAERGVVAWRGTIAGEIPAKAEVRPAPAIREAVRRLLRDFP